MSKKTMCLIDVDQTLANSAPYLHLYEHRRLFEWERSMQKHECFEDVKGLVNRLYDEGHMIVIATARDARAETYAWLLNNGIKFDRLHTGILQRSTPWCELGVVKRQLFEKVYKDNYELFLVVDDQKSVIDAFKDIASTFQVNPQGLK